MFNKRSLTVAIAAVVLIAGVAPGAAMAAKGQTDADASLRVTIEVTNDATVLTVHQDGKAAANAEGSVTPVGDALFAGSGAFQTDSNGSVRLPVPDENVTVRLSIATDEGRASGVVAIRAPEHGEWETTIGLATAANVANQTSAEFSGAQTSNAEASSGSESDAVLFGLVDIIHDVAIALGVSDGDGSARVHASGESNPTAGGHAAIATNDSDAASRHNASIGVAAEGGTAATVARAHNRSSDIVAEVSADGHVDAEADLDARAEAETDTEHEGETGGSAEGSGEGAVNVSTDGESESNASDADAKSSAEADAESSAESGGSGETNVNGTTADGSADSHVEASGEAESESASDDRAEAEADASSDASIDVGL